MAANKRLISRHSQGSGKLNGKESLPAMTVMKGHVLARMEIVWNSPLLVVGKKEQLL